MDPRLLTVSRQQLSNSPSIFQHPFFLDGSPSCLGGSSHGWVPVKTHSTTVPTSVGRLWVAHKFHYTHESKKTQHDNNMVAEQVLRDLSVRRTSVVRSFGAQSKCVFMECADVPDVTNTV